MTFTCKPCDGMRSRRVHIGFLRPCGMCCDRKAICDCSWRNFTNSHKRRLLAGSIFLMFGETDFYAFNGCRRRDLVLKPNDAEVPEHHRGLSFFKKKWGAEERWRHRYYYPAPQKFENGALHLNRTHRVLKIVWRRLPDRGNESFRRVPLSISVKESL